MAEACIQKYPIIQEFKNIHLYLQAYYSFRKGQDEGFSYGKWTNELGLPFSSRSYLRLVVFGKRRLSEELLEAFLVKLPLPANEKEIFKALNSYSEAKDLEQRQFFWKKIKMLSGAELATIEEENYHRFVGNPLLPPLMTLLSFNDVEKNPESLANMMGASEEEMLSALQLLVSMGLAQENTSASGKVGWVSLKKDWKVSASFSSPALEEFYRNSFTRAADSINGVPAKSRRYRSLFLAMNEAEFEGFLADFEVFAQERLRVHDTDILQDRRLYQLLFSFFPVSE